jgi:hypothetical protein
MPSTSPRSLADVSVILIGHDQDVLIHGSIVSAERAAARAHARGLSIELILLLRDPTPALAKWSADRIGISWRVLTSSAQDHGAAHNEAIAASSGRYIAWIDGWDLWSENWIEAAVLAAERAPAAAVWHPEAVVRFGQNFFSTQGYALLWQPDGAAGEIDYAALLDEAPYPTGPFAARSLFDEIPFPTEDAARGWADACWWWTCNVAGAGYHHAVVRETFHYQRMDRANQRRSAPRHQANWRIGPTPLSRAQAPTGRRDND